MKKQKPIRWTICNAASEFGVNEKSLSSYLKTASIRPGRDGKFSTVQIAQALYDDEHLERVKLVKAQAERTEIENSKSKEELVPVIVLADRMRPALVAMASLCRDCQSFEPEERADFMKCIQQLYASVFGDKVTNPKLISYLSKNKLELPPTKR